MLLRNLSVADRDYSTLKNQPPSLLPSLWHDRDAAAAQRRSALPVVGLRLENEIARRVWHVEIDIQCGLSEGADLERRLDARGFTTLGARELGDRPY